MEYLCIEYSKYQFSKKQCLLINELTCTYSFAIVI
jgi:hypothetical protein